ncbi:KTSC domain-containing protein [Rhizobium sp. NZLR8]|uniref:KTSC domain-containing protein n=1 Tax=Rhizobium sp. NZLR8 TaxID=2731104 RepID=UPI001C83F7DF|nr:KTSC domain-containing protein [Rhizobium sp. NZLR8]MBX5158885.1 KTSC domain-containing protein [Rhizobium sp. NZLR8]
MGVRMQTFLIKSRDIEALHYNADARLLLIKYSSGDIRSFTGVSPRAMRRLLGAGPEIGSGSGSSDLEYQAQIRKGGLKALHRLRGISPSQFDFSARPRIW